MVSMSELDAVPAREPVLVQVQESVVVPAQEAVVVQVRAPVVFPAQESVVAAQDLMVLAKEPVVPTAAVGGGSAIG